MPALGDYLGALLAEVTNARLQADLETARVAQLYAAHPLLQHMPVPRFRLPTVSLELPVAVESIDQPPKAPPTAMQVGALRQQVDKTIEDELAQRSVQLTVSRRRRLTQDLTDVIDTFQTGQGVSAADAIKASTDAAKLVVEAIKGSSSDRTSSDPAVESALVQRLGTVFLTVQPPPPQVQVLVVTAQLRDIAPAIVLTRVHLTIREDGVEWTQTNPSDTSSRTLLPE